MRFLSAITAAAAIRVQSKSGPSAEKVQGALDLVQTEAVQEQEACESIQRMIGAFFFLSDMAGDNDEQASFEEVEAGLEFLTQDPELVLGQDTAAAALIFIM